MKTIFKTDVNGNIDLFTSEVSGEYYHQTFATEDDAIRYCKRYGYPCDVKETI